MASVPFNNLITFSRGSNATLTGPDGLVQWAPNNLLTFSEQFDNAAWQKFGGGVATAPAVTANAGIAPDGTTTADRVQFALNGGATSTDRSLLSQSATLATSFPYTYSIWVRSLSGTLSMGIGCDNLVGNTPITVTTTWQRFTVSGTATGTAGVALLQLRGGQAPTQSNAADVLVWGAQLELGSTATTYNSTTVKNLLGFSEAFDNAAWLKLDASIVTGAQANPVNGAFNAQKLMENTANAAHYVYRDLTVASGTPYVLSIYAKKAGNDFVRLYITQETAGAWFNLNTGVVGTILGTGVTASITSVGDGWYRCSITKTATGTSWRVNTYMSKLDNSTSYTGDGNSGVYIYGAQLSDSASLDPYVPTPGAAPSSTAYYGPRFDYDPVTLAPKGLLVEEARTNLLTYSEQFDNAAWSKINCTVTTNATTSPDGTTNAEKLIVTNALSTGNVSQIPTLAASTAYTETVFAKKGEWNWVALETRGEVGDPLLAWFNLNTGVVGTVNVGATATITNFGNGWYRCSLTRTTGATTTSSRARVYATNADAVLSTGDGTSGIFIYGAQLEAGAFATSYIPTVASTVTRSADAATMTGTNFSSWFNPVEGSFVADFDALVSANTSSAQILSAWASLNNLNRVWIWSGAPGIIRNSVVSGGIGQSELTGATVVANTPIKAAAAYRVNDYAFVTNGGAVGTDVSGALPVGVSLLGIGQRGDNQEFLNGHIRSIAYIPARAADFQLQALTL